MNISFYIVIILLIILYNTLCKHHKPFAIILILNPILYTVGDSVRTPLQCVCSVLTYIRTHFPCVLQ